MIKYGEYEDSLERKERLDNKVKKIERKIFNFRIALLYGRKSLFKSLIYFLYKD